MPRISAPIAAALASVFLVAASPVPTQEDPRSATLEHGTDVLAGVALDASTPIADLVADPEAHEGSTLQVEGTVVAMCQMMGCWAALDDGNGNRVNVQVQDGVIDLRDLAASAHYMIAEGVFQTEGAHGPQVWIMEHGARVWNAGSTES